MWILDVWSRRSSKIGITIFPLAWLCIGFGDKVKGEYKIGELCDLHHFSHIWQAPDSVRVSCLFMLRHQLGQQFSILDMPLIVHRMKH